MHTALKRRIINGIEFLPYGHDLYLQLARKRLGITYRGVFASSGAARANVRKTSSNEYDIINEKKGENLELELPIIDQRVLDIDYPLLFWLAQLLKPCRRVLDLGGSLGQTFYSFENYISYPDDIHWVVAELPAATKVGQWVATQKQEARLSFIDSNCISQAPPTDIFLSAGTLQYMETPLTVVLDQLQTFPAHVLIHNLPAHPTRDYWTLQQLEICEVPYRIHALSRLIDDMDHAGYTLMDQWKNARQVEIPYHPEHRVEQYFGFYFKLRCTH